MSETTITFGSENVFESASTLYESADSLDSSHVVVAYRDSGNSNYPTAVVGSISGNTITWGTPSVVASEASTDVSVVALDSTHFVVTYRDFDLDNDGNAKIGVTDGNTTISSFGAENTFTTNNATGMNMTALDSTHFVIVYRDGGDSNKGTAIVGLTNGGTTISSYGSSSQFNTVSTNYVSVAALDSTHFVVSYQDAGGDTYGHAKIGVTSGTTISSYGAENTFNSANTAYTSVAALDSTHFVVAYRDIGNSSYGTAIVGLTNGGTTISSYGSENVYNSSISSYNSVIALDSNTFLVAYTEGSVSASAIIGTTSGTTISGYGTENTFNNANTSYTSAAKLSSKDFVIAYVDNGNSSYGTGIAGSIPAAASNTGAFFQLF